MWNEKFTKILTIRWKEDSRLTDDAFTLACKVELQKLIDAEKSETLAGYPDDFTVVRAFSDQESADSWEATMQSLATEHGYTIESVVHQERTW